MWHLFSSKEIGQVHELIKVEQQIVSKKDVEMVDFDCMRVIALAPFHVPVVFDGSLSLLEFGLATCLFCR